MERVLASKDSVLARRIGAFITDHIIMTFIAMLPVFLNFSKLAASPSNFLELFFISVTVFILLYLTKDIFAGRSIGKILFGIYVRDYQNIDAVPPLYRLMLRNLSNFIWPVEVIMMLSDKENRRLGDKLGKSQVIGYAEKVVLRIVVVGVVAFLFFASTLFAGITQLIKNDSSYKTAIRYIERHDSIKKVTGKIRGYGYFPSGGVRVTDGHGVAQFNIKVKGEKKDLTVFVTLEKNMSSEWKIKTVKY